MAGSMSDAAAPARPVLCASIAVFRAGKVLLIRRAKAPSLGLYSLPGGRIEPGETLREGALRELAEEVGIRASIAGFVDHIEYVGRDDGGNLMNHAVVCAFAGHWEEGEPAPSDEVSGWVWVDPFAPGDLPMTQRLPEILARAAGLIVEEAA